MSSHISVLLEEALGILSLQKGDRLLDATVGEAGHSLEVWKRFSGEVSILGIDADPRSIKVSKEVFEKEKAKAEFKVLNFRKIKETKEISDFKPTKILFDLGWNRGQFDSPAGESGNGRGFSFQKDEPLLMTFGEKAEGGFTAYDIVNSWDQENIETIISAYGEEKFAWKIAKRIVEEREKAPIKTSMQLAEIVKGAVPVFYRFKRIHPATKTFQALRIAVNDELRALEEGLNGAFETLENGGKIAVITFHSLEDRIVKKYFRSLAESGKAVDLTKRPIIAGEEELERNPRSRSAKLRALQKI